MATESTPTSTAGQRFRAERTENEVVLRFPSPNRLLRAVLPHEAVQHMYAAQREQLLALRSVIDAAIGRIEAAQNEDLTSRPRRTEITVE